MESGADWAGTGGSTLAGLLATVGVDAPWDGTAVNVGAALVVTVVLDCEGYPGRQARAIAAIKTATASAAAGISHRRRGAPRSACAPTCALADWIVAGADRLRAAGAGVVGATVGPSPCGTAVSVNACAKSMHRGKRSAGFLASAAASTGSSLASSARLAAREGGGTLRWRLMTTAGLECGNSCDPVRIW
jgi:hypothetical protein